jgi:uncharacterized protein YkwD
MGDVAFLPDDAAGFDSGKPAHIEISVSKSATPFSMDAATKPVMAYQADLAIASSYVTDKKENISAFVDGSDLKIVATPAASSDPIRGEAYVTLPSGNVQTVKFPASALDSDGHLKKGAISILTAPLSEAGQYLVEVMYVNGFPAFNAPVVFGSPVITLLPNEYDNASKDSSTDLSTVSSDALRYVNALRAKVGKSRIVLDSELTRLAQFKAQDMAAYNYVGHDDSQGQKITGTAKRAGVSLAGSVGENVAGGSVSVDFLLAGLALSGGHRENMLGDWSKMGAAAVVKDGLVYYAQVYEE